MLIDEKIKSALMNVKKKEGLSYRRMSAKINNKISASTLLRWVNGTIPDIRDSNLNLLYDIIKNQLSDDHELHNLFGDSSKSKKIAAESRPEYNAKILTTPQSRMIPVISMASAASYEPAFDPFDEFVENNAIGETVYVGDLKDNCIAIKIEGDSMSPKFPNGTIVIVDTKQLPQRGDYVIARMQDNGIVFKQYFRKDNVIELRSINPEGKNYKWHCKEQPGYCMFMWPALEAKTDLRRQRWEEKKS